MGLIKVPFGSLHLGSVGVGGVGRSVVVVTGGRVWGASGSGLEVVVDSVIIAGGSGAGFSTIGGLGRGGLVVGKVWGGLEVDSDIAGCAVVGGRGRSGA
jgi:hypothetical protein